MAIDALLFDGCEALDALGPIEVMRYGGLDVRAVALGGARAVRTSQGLEVPTMPPRESADWLVIPGGEWDERHKGLVGEGADRRVAAHARRHRLDGGMLAAVCTGSMWLAEAGLIGPRPATTHHRYWDELAGYGVDVRRGARVVDDGDLVTSGGVTSGLFLGLHLIGRLVGADARRAIELEIELPDIPTA